MFLIFSCKSDDNSDDVYCTEIYVYGLKVTSKDAIGNTIVMDGITVIAKDDSYEEQLIRIDDSNYFISADERTGSYVLEITSANYQTLISTTVLVDKTEDDCHFITGELEFILQPN